MSRHLCALATILGLAACGGEDPPPPPPTKLAITLLDAATGARLAGEAHVVVIGRGTAGALSARVPLPSPQFEGDRFVFSGGFLEVETAPTRYTLRVDAVGYVSSPEPFTPPHVVNVAANVTTAVELRLEPSGAPAGAGVITGRVVGADGAGVGGVLVHAASTIDFSTLTDAAGHYVLLGLSNNLYRVQPLVAGLAANARTNIDVGPTRVEGVDFTLMPNTGATITATLGAAAPGGAATTSVALALAGTGEPLPGGSVKVSLGAMATIAGVPKGRWIVQAALERDGQVVSPDLIRRRMPPVVDVGDAPVPLVSLPITPTVGGLRVDTSSVPRFSWDAYPGASFYVVEVRALGGQLLWGGLDARGQPQFRVNAPSTTLVFGELSRPLDALASGRTYRARVFAGRDVPATGTFELIAGSEALDGRFRAR